MLLPKIGGVPAHPANVHRLLARRGAARARLPRGPQGHREALQGPLPAAPLRPRRLRRGGDARPRADRPGRASSAPRRRRRSSPTSTSLQRLTGLLYFPITPTFPHFGLARDARLPAGEVPHPLPRRRSPPTTWATSRGRTRRSCRPSPTRSAHDPGGRARHGRQARARSGSDERRRTASRRILVTGPVDLLGRPARPGARARPEPSRRSSASTARPDASSSSAPSSSASATQHALHPPDRPGGRDRHGRRHAPGRRLDRHDRRARAHENNVIGTMNILAACSGPGLAGAQGRLQVLARTTTAASRTTPRSSPRRWAARTRRARRSSATSSRPSAPSRDFAERNPERHRHACCASPTASGPDLRTSHTPPVRAARRARDPRLRPALPVHPRGRHRRLPRARRRATTSPASTTRRPTACSRCREIAGLLGKPLAPVLPPWGTGLAARRCAARRASASRPRCCSQLRFGRGLDNRRLKATGYRYRYTTRETVLSARASTSASSRSCAARRASPTATSARSRSSCAAAPASRPGAPPRRRRAAQQPRRRRPRPAPTTTSTRTSSSRCCPRWTPTACVALHEHEAATRPAATVLVAIERSHAREPGRMTSYASGASDRSVRTLRCASRTLDHRRRRSAWPSSPVGAGGVYAYDYARADRSPRA